MRRCVATIAALVLFLSAVSASRGGTPLADFHPRIHLEPPSPYFFWWYDPASVKPRVRLVPREGPPHSELGARASRHVSFSPGLFALPYPAL